LVARNRHGQPLASKVGAHDDPCCRRSQLLAPRETPGAGRVATRSGSGAVRDLQEWQAIMDHMRRLPAAGLGALLVIPVDDRAAEVQTARSVAFMVGLSGLR